MENQTTLILTTSHVPTHPDTSIIDKAINSLKNTFVKTIITYDAAREKNDDYDEYIKKMVEKYPLFIHLIQETNLGFRNSLKSALDIVETPFVVILQHDVEICGALPFKSIEKLPLSQWNIISTNHLEKGLNKPTHWYPIINDAGPLMKKTFGWCERIFIAKTEFLKNKCLNATTKAFLETQFFSQFKTLYKKLEKIKSYKQIPKISIHQQTYDDYWDDWRCYTLKSDVCYHRHLCGRTST